MEQSDILESHYALQVAFETMQERCKQLEQRIDIVEEENVRLHQQYDKNNSVASVIKVGDENGIIQNQQRKIEELKKEKSQLAHHIFMVSSENRQLWKRLTRLTRANKTLGSHLTKISDTLKQHTTSEVPAALTYSFKDISGLFRGSDKNNLPDNEEKEHSLEEISLKLINSIMLEKSELEQYAEIVELQTNTEMNLKNIGFTYPEDVNVDSLEQLKYHDAKLLQIKDALLRQRSKLQSTLENLKKTNKNKICNACKNRVEKLTRQAGTQFDLDDNIKENGTTQTSLTDNLMTEEKVKSDDDNICPLCAAVYKKTIPFDVFHEHVVNHFTKEVPDGFEIVT